MTYLDEADYEEYTGKNWSPYFILALIAVLVTYYFVKGRL